MCKTCGKSGVLAIATDRLAGGYIIPCPDCDAGRKAPWREFIYQELAAVAILLCIAPFIVVLIS